MKSISFYHNEIHNQINKCAYEINHPIKLEKKKTGISRQTNPGFDQI